MECPSEEDLFKFVEELGELVEPVFAHLVECESCRERARSMLDFSQRLDVEREVAALQKADPLSEADEK